MLANSIRPSAMFQWHPEWTLLYPMGPGQPKDSPQAMIVPFPHFELHNQQWISSKLHPLNNGHKTEEAHVGFWGLGRGIGFSGRLCHSPYPLPLSDLPPTIQISPISPSPCLHPALKSLTASQWNTFCPQLPQYIFLVLRSNADFCWSMHWYCKLTTVNNMPYGTCMMAGTRAVC